MIAALMAGEKSELTTNMLINRRLLGVRVAAATPQVQNALKRSWAQNGHTARKETQEQPRKSAVLPETGLTLHSGHMVYTIGIWGESPDAVENV